MKSKNCVLLLLLMLMFSTIAFSQGRTISGKVVDNSGQGIPGATIAVKGTRTTVVSNADGEFSIPVNSSNDVLEASSIGYEKLEIPVGTGSTVNVTLTTAVGGLSEVVVTALGVSKAQKALGYATTTIKSDDLEFLSFSLYHCHWCCSISMEKNCSM